MSKFDNILGFLKSKFWFEDRHFGSMDKIGQNFEFLRSIILKKIV